MSARNRVPKMPAQEVLLVTQRLARVLREFGACERAVQLPDADVRVSVRTCACALVKQVLVC